MNSFCRYCTGDDREEVIHCDDTNCPFYPFKWADITHEDDREISKKLIGETNNGKEN